MPYMNRNFYYNMRKEQSCLQDCYNTRMKLHFGSLAQSEDMLIDFNTMKRQFRELELINPTNKIIYEYTDQPTDTKIN